MILLLKYLKLSKPDFVSVEFIKTKRNNMLFPSHSILIFIPSYSSPSDSDNLLS